MTFMMINRKTLTYILSALSFFFVGLEYAVIIPTLNEFLLNMNASSSYVGLVLSAMNFSSLFSNLIFGRITDVTKKTKALVIVGNLFKFAGSVMYLYAVGPNFLVISRFVVGLGSGSDSSIISMISRSSIPAERTSLMSNIFAGRQAGLMFGPACNFFLQYFNFWIGPVHVNKYTAPGFFLAAIWLIHTVFVFFFYYDLEYYADEDEGRLQEKENREGNAETCVEIGRSKSSFLKEVFKELTSEQCVVLLGLTFAIMFVRVGVEALITPLSYLLLRWGDLENSVYYSVTGVLYVIGLLSLSKVSKFASDRSLVMFGLTWLTANNLMFLVFVFYAFNAQGAAWVEAIFILYGVVLCIPLSYAWVPMLSLFSKLTSAKNQGFNQGIRMFCAKIGQIMGPLWSSSLMNNLTLMASVNAGLLLLLLAMFVCSYKRFPPRELRDDQNSDYDENETDEAEPLLPKTRNREDKQPI